MHISFFLILFFVFAQAFGQEKEKYTCPWGKGMVVDGDLEDWSDMAFHDDQDNELLVAFKQDSAFIYLAIDKTENAKKGIQLGGVQIRLSSADKSVGITYPACTKTVANVVNHDFDFLIIDQLDAVVNDTISVFNEFGIVAQGSYSPSTIIPPHTLRDKSDLRGNDRFVAEFCIPKQYLSLTEDASHTIKVHIAVRGNDIDRSGRIFEKFRSTAERNNMGNSLLLHRYKQLNLSSESVLDLAL